MSSDLDVLKLGSRPEGRTLLTADWLLCHRDGGHVFDRRSDLVIEGRRILRAGPRFRGEVARRVDLGAALISPGLIDAHGHAGHCLIRGIGADTSPLWMKIVTPTCWHFTTSEFWYAEGMVLGLERPRARVTTGVSIISSMPRSDDPQFAAGHARAYDQIGLREIVCTGPAGLPWPRSVTRRETGSPVRRSISFAEMMEGGRSRDRDAGGYRRRSHSGLSHALHHRALGRPVEHLDPGSGSAADAGRPRPGPRGQGWGQLYRTFDAPVEVPDWP